MNKFPVLPKSKIPAIKEWQKKASNEEAEYTDLFAKVGKERGIHHSEFNVGVATGEQSGIFVVDVDPKSGGFEGLAKLEEDIGSSLRGITYTVTTGSGGLHIYFKYPDNQEIRNTTNLKNYGGIDIRGQGGFVVGAGSTHENGNTYSVKHQLDIIAAPKALLDLLTPEVPTRVQEAFTSPLTPGEKGALSRRTLEFLAEGIEEGKGWNDGLFKAAKDMQEQGYNYDEALVRFETMSNPHYTGQLTNVDKRTIKSAFDSYAKYEARVREDKEDGSATILAGELVHKMFEYLKDKDKVMGEPTGISQLDEMLGGGKRLGELTVLQAEAKSGKNTLYHYMMYLWLERGIPVGYASRELTPHSEVLPNILSIHLKKNLWKAEITEELIIECTEKLKQWPLYFANGYGYFPAEDMKRWFVKLKTQGVNHFWLDHLHYMLSAPEEHAEASKLIKNLKTWTKELDISVDLIVQPNKLQMGQALDIGSLKGGAAIGQALDNLITMKREVRDNRKINVVKIELARARHKLAKPGEPFYLEYDPETTCFSKTEYIPDSEHPDNQDSFSGGWNNRFKVKY